LLELECLQLSGQPAEEELRISEQAW
jgi:hypothetical protein